MADDPNIARVIGGMRRRKRSPLKPSKGKTRDRAGFTPSARGVSRGEVGSNGTKKRAKPNYTPGAVRGRGASPTGPTYRTLPIGPMQRLESVGSPRVGSSLSPAATGSTEAIAKKASAMPGSRGAIKRGARTMPLPPGIAKRATGAKSARSYAPGQRGKTRRG